jgi:hypothetical protein
MAQADQVTRPAALLNRLGVPETIRLLHSDAWQHLPFRLTDL